MLRCLWVRLARYGLGVFIMVGLASSLCLFSDEEDELDLERDMDRVYDSESDDLEEWLNSD